MGDLGNLLGSIFGGGGGGDAAEGFSDVVAGLFEGGREGGERGEAPIVYERYLCGGPKSLDVNDR